MSEEYTEYGVQRPDGTISWGVFLGRSLATEQDRSLVHVILHKTAEELGWPADEFINRFRWVPRQITVNGVRHTMDSPEVLEAPIPDTLPEPDPIESTNGAG